MADSINYQLAHFVASYGKASQIPPSTCPEVSFVGRSNVGKSSLINALANRKDNTSALATRYQRQRRFVQASAVVDVDEVHRHESVAHARLAGAGRADLDLFQLQLFGAADLVQPNGVGHGVVSWGHGAQARGGLFSAPRRAVRWSA